jgi:hypothetical protein
MLLKLLQKEYILINWATHQAYFCVFNVQFKHARVHG